MLTRRAVLPLGKVCSLRCKFCYYRYEDRKKWVPLDECKRSAKFFREVYKDTLVDLMGGEPTIHPHILELVRYCRDIGLRPTIITNCQALADMDRVKKIKDAGLEDFLCSLPAWGEKYDSLVQKKGGFKIFQKAIGNLNAAGVEFRANSIMTAENKDDLPAIARYIAESGGKAVSFLAYLPFHRWELFAAPDFQAKHADIAPNLKRALDYCDSAGLEANVRYFPFCFMKEHPDKCYNLQQMPYDPGECDFFSWFSNYAENPGDKNGYFKFADKYTDASFDLSSLMAARPYSSWFGKSGGFTPSGLEMRERVNTLIARGTSKKLDIKPPKCAGCSMYEICDGLKQQYLHRFGDGEIAPLPGEKITDPGRFVRHRKKYIFEKEALLKAANGHGRRARGNGL